jgi:serine protease Do
MTKRYIWLIAVLLVAVLVLASCGKSAKSVPTTTTSPVITATPISTPTPTPVLEPSSPSAITPIEAVLESIYTQVNPSVVNIHVTESAGEGLASGFVWDEEGHIATNNHVVDGAINITVTFSDGTTVPAQVVGTDPDSDLAVVKVDVAASELHPVQLADSTQAKVGQLTVAIGNPFGLQGTMTVGFISALGRLLPVDSSTSGGLSYNIPDIIQTDASINPGNSGGVLVDDAGHVIGVPSAIISPAGSSAGIGFAIPSVIVQRVVPALITTGHYEHSYLGISGISLDSELAKAMGLTPDQRGALVVNVVADGPAAKAGLQGGNRQVTINGQQVTVGGDIIISVDGKQVKGFDDLITYLARSTDVGQKITLTMLRQGKEETVEVTLAARPS